MSQHARTGPPVRTIVARLGLLAGILLALVLALGGQPLRLGGARPIATSGGQGYWLLAKDGGVFAYGDAGHHGNNLNSGNDIVGLAPTPTLEGYWTADDDGTVFAYGDAVDHGSRASSANDIRAFAARPQGDGYWLVTGDGVVTARGAAGHHGNAPALGSGRKVVGMVSTPSGKGYWLVGRDGGVFAFGDAGFFGSTGAMTLNQPIVGMASTPSGNGYWFVASDGGVFAFAGAGFFGSTGANPPASGIVGISATPSGNGYRLVAGNGKVFPFGDAANYGDASTLSLSQPVIGIFATPVVHSNQVPAAVADSASVAEDGSASVSVLANDTGLGDGPISVSIVSGPAHGTATVAGNKINYSPAANYNGPDSITYKVTDGDNESSTAVLSFTVTAVNDAPVASGGSLTTNEDTLAGATLSASDVDGNSLTFAIVTPPAHGSVMISGSNYTYTPAANYHGPDSFTFRANDGSANSNTATVSVTVNPVNDAPVVENVAVPAAEDTLLSSSLAGFDADGDALSFAIVAGPAHGVLTPGVGGAYTYLPGLEFSGTDTFTYKANDGTVDSNTATVTITVAPVDDPAVAEDGSLATDEDVAAQGQLSTSSDIDGGDPNFAIVSGPTHGEISGLDPVTGDYTYTPDADYNGSDSFTFAAQGDEADSEAATISITVNSIEDAPVFVDSEDVLSTDEDTELALELPATDGDDDALTYAIVDAGDHPELGEIDADGNVTFTPAANFHGSYSFTVSVTDDHSAPVTKDVTITVVAVNDDPTFDGSSEFSGTGLEESAIDGDVDASDVDDDTLVFSIEEGHGPANGIASVDGETGEWSYTGGLDFAGLDSFTITVTDGNGGSSEVEIDVTVTNVNDAPTVSTIGNQSTDEDTPLEIPFTVADPDTGDDLEIIVASGDPGISGTLAVTGEGTERILTITPALDANGSALIFVAVSDGEIPVLQEFLLTVNPVNDLPEADALAVTTDEDTPKSGTLTGDDPVEGSPLTFALDGENGGAEHGTVTLEEDGDYTYEPAENYNGPDSFSFVVNDGDDDSLPAPVSITVTPVNDLPVADAGELTTAEDTEGSGTLTGSDPVEDSALTFALDGANGGADHGTVSLDSETGVYTYEPDADFNGSDSFSFVVNDGDDDDSLPAPVSITVTPVNDAPVVSAIEAQSVDEDEILVIDFSATDVDGDLLTIHKGSTDLTLIPAGGLTLGGIDDAHRTLTVDSADNLFGAAQIFLSVSDGTAPSILRLIPVEVLSVNDNPVITEGAGPVALPVDEDDSDGESVSFTATDIEDAAEDLAWSASDPDHGTVTPGETPGTFTYVPDPDFDGAESFTITVTDSDDGTDTIQVDVTIGNLNDDPVTANDDDAGNTPEDTDLENIDVLGNDSYVDGLAAENPVQIVSATHGTAEVNEDNTVTFTPDADYNGPASFVYSVTDADGASTDTATVSIDVTPADDPVTANDDDAGDLLVDAQLNSFNVLDNDSYVDGLAAENPVQIVSATHGTAEVNEDNTVTFTPDADYNGPASFVYSVTDADGASTDTATVTINYILV